MAIWNRYIIAICYFLRPFGNLVAIWYIFPRFGILCQEKSGNPARTLFFYKAALKAILVFQPP
jgi:hypothetical protein